MIAYTPVSFTSDHDFFIQPANNRKVQLRPKRGLQSSPCNHYLHSHLMT